MLTLILDYLYRPVFDVANHLLIDHFLIHSILTAIILKPIFLNLYIIHDIGIPVGRVDLFESYLTGEIFRSLCIEIYFKIIFDAFVILVHELDLMIDPFDIRGFFELFQLFEQLFLFLFIINPDFLKVISFIGHRIYTDILQIVETHQINIIIIIYKEIHLHHVYSYPCVSFYEIDQLENLEFSI